LVQDPFSDLTTAPDRQVPHGLLLAAEHLVWAPDAGRRSYEGLQRRAAARGRSGPGRVARWPAYFVAFDVLQLDGVELLARPYRERRARLEDLFTGHGLRAPWALCPMTTDLAKAREWCQCWLTFRAGRTRPPPCWRSGSGRRRSRGRTRGRGPCGRRAGPSGAR
ncbi:ATP-dependent DNA ligase, partial [Streptomyces sp. NPDC054840]